MENKAIMLIFPLLILSSSCFVSQSYGKKVKNGAFSHLYNEIKSKNAGSIDRSHFSAISQTNHYNYSDHFGADDDQDQMKERDRIERLPGQPSDVRFKHYGGYVTVDRPAGRALYYYFVEAHKSHNSLPLLLWLNGGPGCSSLAFGAMTEIGPFRVHSDGKTLYKNKYAWNHAANTLFLESPVGVGFSYSNTTTDVETGGDRRTAIDNYNFLLNWLERFPKYKNRDFFIAGESYAGHYVPQLAHTILHHNKKGGKTIINLKGIIIGNALMNDETDIKGMYEYLASHAIISDETWKQILKHCDFSDKNTHLSDECNEATDDAAANTDAIDIYNIYAPLCSNSSLTHNPKNTSEIDFDPCSDYYVQAYLNRHDVQQALHANITKIPYQWQACSDVIGKWVDSPLTVIPLLRELLANGLRVWIYSGDTDGMIPVTSTKNTIEVLKLPLKTPWHPWYLGGQVGGYTEEYEGNLTFATVRGAGHQVPTDQPARALSLIMHFLSGTHLPNSSIIH
ncbi:Serine carboxypeptidase-like 40 [Sesamum alatum]|uniref:Carboxypeptidase n=1 Tax=Sesamum alatum TaxID=300844 RepID=A0AAE1XMF1_9LAMI|nr:Serine carboxypeptidase-like 40 [Sesamum alatum]